MKQMKPRRARRQSERDWLDICCLGCTSLQLFWPSFVLRKWLNRETRDSDFSADERDTETEDSDDDLSCWERELCNEVGKSETVHSSQNGNRSEALQCKLRRRNSETLRTQYINTKELKIVVGTWNVGGRIPPDDQDIDDMLDVEEPADLYVLGFQEIVPLNAGNIFGAEDSRPVPKWEYLIRDTLNRIHPVKPKYKCYSDPSSPSRFKPSDDDPVLEDDLLDTSSDSDNEEEIHLMEEEDFFIDTSGTEFQYTEQLPYSEGADIIKRHHSTTKLDRLHLLKLEDDLQSESSPSQGKAKLTQTLSISERIGLSWPEKPLDFLPQRVFERLSSFRSMKSFKETKSFKLPSNGDSKGLPVISILKELDLEALVNRKRRSTYVRIVSKQMVGIFLSIWVKRSLRRHIQNLKISTIGVGVMGYIGNKGSISVSMSIYQTLFCFICTHLTSGEKDGDELRRNADVQEILHRTHFSTKSIHEHEKIIWFGDLNYRINLPYEKTREHISKKEWTKLAEKDQLIRELKKGRAFDGWSEGTLDFPPTYKYEFNSDKYVGEDPKAGRRTPAWCDRILSFGKGMKLLKYKRVEQKLSDHRPVTATFMVEVEAFCHRKLQRALTFTDAEIENSGIDDNVNQMRVGKDFPDWER